MIYDTGRAGELGSYEEQFDGVQEELTLPLPHSFVSGRRLLRSARKATYRKEARTNARQECELIDPIVVDISCRERSQEQRLDMLQEIGEVALVERDPMQTFILSMPTRCSGRGNYRDTLGV